MDTQPFYCSKCLSATRRSNLTRAWCSLKTDDGQKNGEDVRRFLKAVQAVADKWAEVKGGSGSFDRRLKLIDQLDIAPALSVPMDQFDDKLNRNRVRRELERLGLREVYPGSRGGFRAFVKDVAERIEGGMSSECIAQRLWNERPGKIKAA
ncbi:MAG TPA: hypothetical protein VIQ24_24360 [Pyrinomonadaceae bacterium]